MIECVTTSCYTSCGGGAMKANKDVVNDHHEKLAEVRVRFPSADICGYDYPAMIRERAEELGLINIKGKDRGKGSANAYILHLIQKDLGIEIESVGEIAKKQRRIEKEQSI